MEQEFIDVYLDNPKSPRLIEILEEIRNTGDPYNFLIDGGFLRENESETRDYTTIIELLSDVDTRKNLGFKTVIDKPLLLKIFTKYIRFNRFYEKYVDPSTIDEGYVEFSRKFTTAVSMLTSLSDIIVIWEEPFVTFTAMRNFIKAKICPFGIPIYDNIFIQHLASYNKYEDVFIPDKHLFEELLKYLSRWENINGRYVLNREILFDRKRMNEILDNVYSFKRSVPKICPLDYTIDNNIYSFYLLLELGADPNKMTSLVERIADLDIDKLFPLLMKNGLRINELINPERNPWMFSKIFSIKNIVARWRKFVHMKNFSKTIETIPFVPNSGREYNEAKMDFEYRK